MIIIKKRDRRMPSPRYKGRFHWLSDFNCSRLKPRFNLKIGWLVAAHLAVGAIMSQAFAAEAGGAADKISGASGGFAVYGTPKYPPDFSHFDYVNPNAPKG